MRFENFKHLACPIDGLPLEQIDNSYKCASGHSYDMARQKYINLLAVQDKRSKNPGDTKEMVLARQGFLNTGLYRPISEHLNQEVGAHITKSFTGDQINIFDAGCGEGYYLYELQKHLKNSPLKNDDVLVSLAGMDISKPAVIEATKRNRDDITWLVGTNRVLPVLEQSLDMILCMFGYPVFDQFAKCIKDQGLIVLVEAAQNHLIEVRKWLYDDIKDKDQRAVRAKQAEGHFDYVHEERQTFTIELSNETALDDLLAMTPYYYRFKDADYTSFLDKHQAITVEIEYLYMQKA